jgi:sugar/nucleoside kinase (ribokinase family)
MKTFDIVTIGHFSIDHILLPRANAFKSALGGSPAYVSFSARQLGAHVGVVSKVGADFPETYINMLKRGGVDLFGLKKEQNSATTSFTVEYSAEKRRLLLKSLAPPIRLAEVSFNFKAESIHVAPIAGEISLEVVDALKAKANVLSLDPQGFLRRFDANGKTSLRKLKADTILEHVDVYKSSLHEVRAIAGKSGSGLTAAMKRLGNFGIRIVIVTLGRRGTALLFNKTFHYIPAFPPRRLIDPTGAGDVFAGAFLAEYLHKKDALWCACVGSAAASFKAETFGTVLCNTKEAIYKRAMDLFEKVYADRDAQRVIDAK